MLTARRVAGVFTAAFLVTAGALAAISYDGSDSEPPVPAASSTPPPPPAAAPAFTITSVEPAVDSLSIGWTVEGVLGERTQMIFYSQGDKKDSYVLEDESRTAVIAGLAPDAEVRFCLVAASDRANESLPEMPEGDAPGCATDKTLPPVPVEPAAAAPPAEAVQEAAVPPAPAPAPVVAAPTAPAPPRAAPVAPVREPADRNQRENGRGHGKGSDRGDDRGNKGHGKRD